LDFLNRRMNNMKTQMEVRKRSKKIHLNFQSQEED